MILVTLGTQNQKFYRLLDMLEHSNIKDDIIVQAGGSSRYKSKKMKIMKFINYDEMSKLIDEASIIITHGGTGSILMPLEKSKKVLAMARLKEHGEHINNHQMELVSTFAREGYLMELKDTDNIEDKIKELKKFKPKKYKSNKDKFLSSLKELIDN